ALTPLILSNMSNNKIGNITQNILRFNEFPVMLQNNFLLKKSITVKAPNVGPMPSHSCSHIACWLSGNNVGKI
ncbi:MAG: hypothetical protein ACI4TD_09735, partial [Phocaeicola sp.]